MGTRYFKKHAVLDGVVGVEDAEELLRWLRASDMPTVGMKRCTHVHAAALQVLLALRPRIVHAPADPWLAHVLGLAPEHTP
jgi:hypothetical protein